MSDKLISILIPVYNEEKIIAECLTALTIIKQKSVYPIEIIVCDNGSTDRTFEIVKQFEPNVLLVREERRGTSIARQTAFEYSQGALIACIDADTARTASAGSGAADDSCTPPSSGASAAAAAAAAASCS